MRSQKGCPRCAGFDPPYTKLLCLECQTVLLAGLKAEKFEFGEEDDEDFEDEDEDEDDASVW